MLGGVHETELIVYGWKCSSLVAFHADYGDKTVFRASRTNDILETSLI